MPQQEEEIINNPIKEDLSTQEETKEEIFEDKSIENLEDVLESPKDGGLEAKIIHYEDLLKRQAADFDNFRKRNIGEKEKLKEYAFDSIFLDFVPIFDNIERAFDASKKDGVTIESINEGLGGIIQMFFSFLEKYQIEKINSIDQPFNPSIHEALFTQEGEYKEKTVIQEVEKAYRRKDKIIRTAKVAVGVPKKDNDEDKK